MSSFDRAQDERKNKKPKYESPKARLARLKAEAVIRGRMVPLARETFADFLRTGRAG